MKIALLAPEFIPPWGGVGVYSYELARQLALLGAEVHVLSPKRKGATGDNLSSLGRGVHIHHLSKANDTFFYNLKFQAAIFTEFKALNRKHRFDIIHAANLVQMPDVFLKLRDIGVPSVTTVHSTFLGQSRIGGKKKYLGSGLAPVERLSRLFAPCIRAMETMYLRNTDHLIFVSQWVKGLTRRNGRVIRNGVDHERFKPTAWRKENNVGSTPTVLFAGRLLAMKGLGNLISALAPLLREKRIRLILAGPGDVRKLRRRLAAFGDSVRVSGPIPYHLMHEAYAEADIFVLPSLTESFPLSVLEAMSSGLPVVASAVGGVPEMIADGKEGFLVPPGDKIRLRQAIARLAEDDGLRKRMGKAGRQAVIKRFTVRKMAEETLGEYRRILAR